MKNSLIPTEKVIAIIRERDEKKQKTACPNYRDGTCCLYCTHSVERLIDRDFPFCRKMSTEVSPTDLCDSFERRKNG